MPRFLSFLIAAAIAGTAAAQRISFSQSTVNVGTTLWHRPVTATFKFKNRDREPLRVIDVDAGCGCLTPEWTRTDIEKGGEGTIKVTYDAQLLGRFDRIILVRTNASDVPVRIRMKGLVATGDTHSAVDLYPFRIGDVGLNTNNVEFPDVNRGDTATYRIEIWNDTKEVYTPQLMHLPSYITATYRPQMLARGRRGFIDLTLHSQGLADMGLNQASIYLQRYAGDKVNEDNEIVVSAILLPDTSDTSLLALASAPPRLTLSTRDLNLGTLGRKKKLTGSVTISNTGASMLNLSTIQVFNSTLQVSIPKRNLMPGESINMKITLLAKYLPSSKSMPRVLIISNDPSHLKETINVTYQ